MSMEVGRSDGGSRSAVMSASGGGGGPGGGADERPGVKPSTFLPRGFGPDPGLDPPRGMRSAVEAGAQTVRQTVHGWMTPQRIL
jgi:hypothetical protein